ncbi:iron complex outermembrane recepter protein [Pararobbsia alpina]|uniref:TonB-dependent receptor n=1 Tax=Pararobbsia alpina TaxID=621374 RepID=UPI0039A5849F
MKQKVLVSAIKKIVGAELLFSTVLVPVAIAQSAPATPATDAAPAAKDKGATKLERVEVTGSLIKQSDKTGYNQVQKVTAKEIEDQGYSTVAEFLHDISANSASSWGESNTNSFAPGGAGIALRGLSEKYTLVLVDGQRVANYALAVNGTDSFFDLNTLPLNIVDHVEIVKTGAVSQYGSDAIAGVVNIITKKNYHGLELDANLGKPQHPGGFEERFSVLGGIGDFATQGWNITAAGSYYKENGFMLSDRDFTASEDFSRYGGSALPTQNAQKINWINADGSTTPLSPCPYNSTNMGAYCGLNNASAISAQAAVERWNGKVHGTYKIDDNIQAYADLWASRNTTSLLQGYNTLRASTVHYDPATSSLASVGNTVLGSNPYNPFGVDTGIRYTFADTPAGVDTTSTFWKASTGIKGSFSTPKFGDWDWGVDVGHSQSTVATEYTNELYVPALQNLLAGGFDFSNPANTPNGTNGLFVNDYGLNISKLDTVTATLSTPNLFTLPAGDVGFGIGTEFRHEAQEIIIPTLQGQGLIAPGAFQTVNGERNVAAVYYQLDIPLIKNLTFSQSGRYDHYGDFGGAFSPRFALRYQPIQQLTAYASYSRGFRAPTLVESSQSTTASVQLMHDPFDPNPDNVDATRTELTRGNPNLQPERTKNYNLGFQLSPAEHTDIGFDYYKIVIDNVISNGDPNAIVAQNDPTQVVRNSDGTIKYVNTSYTNQGSLTTDGFEFTFRQGLPTAFGTFTLSGDWAYVYHFKIEDGSGATTEYAGNNLALNTVFGASFPRWKGNTTLSWDYAKFTTTLSWDYTGPYTNAVGISDATSVSSYSQFNLFATYRGIKNWTIYGGINNLFDRHPPADPVWQYYANTTGYDASLYNEVGRFFQIGATYRWK